MLFSNARCLTIGAFVAACLGLSAPASAQENPADQRSRSQSAVVTGGWMAKGGLHTKDGRGGTNFFFAMLMRPGGDVDGNGPQRPGEPDLREPWVALLQTSTDALGKNRTECVSLANPASARYDGTGRDEIPAIFADVQCDDGRGYDFYRVEWRGTEPMEFGGARSTFPLGPAQDYWSTPYVYDRPHYSGGTTRMSFHYDNSSGAVFRICGHRDASVECLVPVGHADPWTFGVFVGGWTFIRASANRVERTTCC